MTSSPDHMTHGHVGVCPNECFSERGKQLYADPKVTEFDAAMCVEEHVGGLYV